jgi:hypothetical protein
MNSISEWKIDPYSCPLFLSVLIWQQQRLHMNVFFGVYCCCGSIIAASTLQFAQMRVRPDK